MSIEKYGRIFETDSLLSIELFMFKTSKGSERTNYFINCVSEIWPEFTWYEWSLEQAADICENDVSGFTSGASSSKSEMLAKFALVSWYADPVNTLVIVCSTTSTDAKKRVWGAIVASHRKARGGKKSVGHLVETQNIIKLSEKTDAFAASDNSSISLVAAGNEDKNNALQRLQGMKNKHVILLLDELQDCSQEITEFAIWNINANTWWEIHAAGNADSRADAHGIFMQPTEGWSNVNRKTRTWKIRVGGKIGVARHFDATAEDAPNMVRHHEGRPQLPFLRQAQQCIDAKLELGEENATYLRQFCGFWPEKEGESNYIVTEPALVSHEAYDRAEWKNEPVGVAGIDPSYSQNGDRFILFWLRYGLTTHGIWAIEFYKNFVIRPTLIPGEDRNAANIRECKRICEECNIGPRNVGIDSSGGNPIISMAHMLWSPEILGVQFGGAPSDLPISQFDPRISSDIYSNRTSELAYTFVEFLHANQIRGIRSDHQRELCARRFEIVGANKIKIETKTAMKKRVGYSPDIADAGNIGLDVIRTRLKITPGKATPAALRSSGDWKKVMRKSDVVSQSARDFSNRLRVRLG